MTDGYPPIEWVTESPSCSTDPVAKYRTEGEWKQGVRPPHVVETVDDIEWALDHRDADRPNLVCRFCGDTRQVRTFDEASKWFRTHACDGEGVDIETWLAA